MSHDDYAVDPIPGLPENLPPGERLLWQGKPEWRAVAVRVMHVRKVAIYFVLLMIWSVAEARADGVSWSAALGRSSLLLLALAVAAIGILTLLAWFVGRTTIYSITSARLVIRLGIALPMTINLPYSMIESASLKTYKDGTGDLPLDLVEGQRVGYFLLWPHARPWKFKRVQPMLRAVSAPERVAEILAQALAATHSTTSGGATAAAAGSAGDAHGAAVAGGKSVPDPHGGQRNPVPA